MSEFALLQLEHAVEEARRVRALGAKLGPDDMLGDAYVWLTHELEQVADEMAQELKRAGQPVEDMPWWKERRRGRSARSGRSAYTGTKGVSLQPSR